MSPMRSAVFSLAIVFAVAALALATQHTVLTGLAAISYNLSDPASAPHNITVDFSLDGTTFHPATMGPGGDGVSNLAASNANTYVPHVYMWDTGADLGGKLTASVTIRITPNGQTATKLTFDVDNRAPVALATIKAGPFPQATTTSSTKICWQTTSSADSVVNYGLTAALGSSASGSVVTGLSGIASHVVEIDGLATNTTYFYRLLVNGTPDTQTHTFKTAPDATTPFTTLAFGDSGSGIQQQMDLAAVMNQQTFDTVTHMGDVIYPTGAAHEYPAHFWVPYGKMLATHTIFPDMGDHDQYDGLGGAAFADTFFMNANNSAGSKHYYSHVYGNTKFVTIDTGVLFKTQGPWYTWLEQELANNQSRWLVVVAYMGLYSSGAHPTRGVPLRPLLGPLLEKYKVDLVLSGQDHIYERAGPVKLFSTDPSYAGWNYITSGGGGAQPYNLTAPLPWDIFRDTGFHFILLTFGANTISGKMVKLDGLVHDTFTITKSSPTPAGPLATITVAPSAAATTAGGTIAFTATGHDASGNTVAFTPAWTATGGTIAASGVYTAGSTAGTFAATASSGSIHGTATITIGPSTTPAPEVIVDDSTAGFSIVSGAWAVHFNPLRFGSVDHLSSGTATGVARWKPALASGSYDVYAWWPSRTAPASATYTIVTTKGNVSVTVNQSASTTWGVWNKLGTFTLDSTSAAVQISALAGQTVAADAVRFVAAP